MEVCAAEAIRVRLDVVGLGLAIADVVLRVERMPVWEDPSGLLDFALADGGPAGTACFVASTFGLRVVVQTEGPWRSRRSSYT